MWRMRSSARSRAAVAIAATLALLGGALAATAGLAQASPQNELASEQQRAAQLESQIEANGNRVSILDEQYTNAQLAIQNATAQIAVDETQLHRREQQTQSVRDQLAARGAELYMGAGNPVPLQAIDVTSARQLGTRSVYAGAAADQDRQLLDEVKVAVEQLNLQRSALEHARAAATSQSGGSSSVDAGAPSVNVPPPSGSAQVAVDTARAQLGKPYVYAGSGPSVFDCSGLTMYAWAAAGVSLPHNAEAQYESLPHVDQSQLEPGDLVFFGSPIHHVGMYVGGGTMIEAPYTGVDVRYHTIYRPDYAGAARP